MAAKPVPDGYPVLTPYLMLRDAGKAIDYYKAVLGAKERMKMPMPDGRIGHAELELGSSLIMLADESNMSPAKSPQTVGGTAVTLHVYVENSDETFAKAIKAGGTEIRPVQNQFYGDRSGTFRDPFGHIWNVATHIEDVSPEEMNRRLAAMTAKS